jgi:tripeptide aminopeptidase
MNMNVADRFLKYVSYDTQSDPNSETCPSSAKQKILGEALAGELAQMGLENAHIDQHGYVYGWLPATPGCEDVPCLGLIAHMDTSPAYPGAGIKARIVDYQGGDVIQDEAKGLRIRASEDEGLSRCVGKHLIITDGSTLLGADDKAGVAEIITAVEYLLAHPEIKHGRIAVGITPDEEIGRGADRFDVKGFGAAAAYTVDGGELGELEYENFNAAGAKVTFHGFSIHTGSAKNRMKNALLMAMEFHGMLPPAESPAHTEGYEGFYHLDSMAGDVTTAVLEYIIRDHDQAKFQARKATMERIAAYLNEVYGAGTVDLELKDQYYNMKAQIEPHIELIHRAKAAFRKVGVEPREVAIRGGTDGARLSYMGLPCPNLSTGGFNFHGGQEYIPVESMEAMVEVLVQLVQADR